MILALFMLALTLFIFYHIHWKRKGLPLGPIPFPIYGNTLEIGRNPPGYVAFERWTKKFGHVFTVGDFEFKLKTIFTKLASELFIFCNIFKIEHEKRNYARLLMVI